MKDGGVPPVGDEPEPASKTPRWPYAVLLLAVFVLGGGVWTAYDRGLIVEDPGVGACEAMRGGSTTFRIDPDEGKRMTEDEYRRARQVFADSRHEDLREHGTKVMDIAWRMSRTEGQDSLLYAQPLVTQVLGLESACADQGIFLPVDAAGEPPPGKAAAEPASAQRTVTCAQIFRNGQLIAKGFNGTCGGAGGRVQVVPALGCTDGRILYRVASSTGARGGWGFSGAKYQAVGEATSDPAYAVAVQKCLG